MELGFPCSACPALFLRTTMGGAVRLCVQGAGADRLHRGLLVGCCMPLVHRRRVVRAAGPPVAHVNAAQHRLSSRCGNIFASTLFHRRRSCGRSSAGTRGRAQQWPGHSYARRLASVATVLVLRRGGRRGFTVALGVKPSSIDSDRRRPRPWRSCRGQAWRSSRLLMLLRGVAALASPACRGLQAPVVAAHRRSPSQRRCHRRAVALA